MAAVLPAEIGGHAPAASRPAVAARSYALRAPAARRGRRRSLRRNALPGHRGLALATPLTRAAARDGRSRPHATGPGRRGPVPRRLRRPDRKAPRRGRRGDPISSPWRRRLPGISRRAVDLLLARRDVPPLAATVGFPEGRLLEIYGHDVSRRVSMIRFAAPGGARVVRFEPAAASRLVGRACARRTSKSRSLASPMS